MKKYIEKTETYRRYATVEKYGVNELRKDVPGVL